MDVCFQYTAGLLITCASHTANEMIGSSKRETVMEWKIVVLLTSCVVHCRELWTGFPCLKLWLTNSFFTVNDPSSIRIFWGFLSETSARQKSCFCSLWLPWILRQITGLYQIGKLAKCTSDLHPALRNWAAQYVRMHPRFTNITGNVLISRRRWLSTVAFCDGFNQMSKA